MTDKLVDIDIDKRRKIFYKYLNSSCCSVDVSSSGNLAVYWLAIMGMYETLRIMGIECYNG